MAKEKSPTSSLEETSIDADLAADEGGRLTTADVYVRLRRKILDHSIPPATKVNIHHVSQEFGVSPTPVREALRLLQGDNLLVATSNKGYATTKVLDAAGVRDLYEFRLLIEPWAARTAASNRLSNPANVLSAELAGFDTNTDSIQHTLIEHDSRFHGAILSATDNKTVIQAFQQSHCHLHLFRIYRLNWPWQDTIDEHAEILRGIREADPEAAEKAMREHLYAAYERFSSSLAMDTDETASLRAPDGPKLVLGSSLT